MKKKIELVVECCEACPYFTDDGIFGFGEEYCTHEKIGPDCFIDDCTKKILPNCPFEDADEKEITFMKV